MHALLVMLVVVDVGEVWIGGHVVRFDVRVGLELGLILDDGIHP